MLINTIARYIWMLIFFTLIHTHTYAQSDDSKLANEYYQEGDYEKAEIIFEKLAKRKRDLPVIHANYTDLLIQGENYEKAEKFIETLIKVYPQEINYKVSLIRLYHLSSQKQKKQSYLNSLEKEYGNDYYQISLIAQTLADQDMKEEAIDYYLKARKLSNNPWAFALDLATIYRLNGNIADMTNEYLNYADSNPRNLSYIQNIFQTLLTEEKDQLFLEKSLISRIQEFPDQSMYANLLIWLELQRKNFYGAFIQARALDKRMQRSGDQSMRIGRIALDNDSWDESIEIFKYVIDEYPNERNYTTARRLYIEAREKKIKNTYPIVIEEIRSLTKEYDLLNKESGFDFTALQGMRNKALLHAFYLDEKDSAINILNAIIENRRTPRSLASECKLDLGDIYLLIDQPWESTLLYSQVEKSNKDAPLGYEAKLRNAKLNYYRGNFALARDHLDILKLATTRDISNDAILLGILIQDNTVFDTTDHVMQEFANIELLVYQNKNEEAADKLEKMLVDYPFHSLTDEIHWKLAELSLQRADYVSAIKRLDNIIDNYGRDILGDDAFFKKGIILSENLKDDQAALDTFVEFLKKYPGSIYAAEARKKIRKLRGDYVY